MAVSHSELNLRLFLQEKKATLLESFTNPFDTIKVQCEKGHAWTTTIPVLYNGNWCQKCTQEGRETSVDELLKNKGVVYAKDYPIPKTDVVAKWALLIGHSMYVAGLDAASLESAKKANLNTVVADPDTDTWIPTVRAEAKRPPPEEDVEEAKPARRPVGRPPKKPKPSKPETDGVETGSEETVGDSIAKVRKMRQENPTIKITELSKRLVADGVTYRGHPIRYDEVYRILRPH